MAKRKSSQLTLKNIFRSALMVLLATDVALAFRPVTSRVVPENPCPSLLAASGSVVQAATDATTLEPGKALEREISGGQQHRYQLALTAGQFASITIQQGGIDVAARLLGVDGKLIAEFDFESRNLGQEQIEWVAEAAGSYKLEVAPTLKNAAASRYQIRLNDVRSATERDRALYEAGKQLAEATRLQRAQKPSDALPLAERAAQILEQTLGTESQDYARALRLVAAIYAAKKEFAKAETLFQKTLDINERTLGPEHPDVALTLHNMAIFYSTKGDTEKALAFNQRALELREKALDGDHFYIGYTLLNYAQNLFAAQDYAKAAAMYQRAAAILEKSLGDDHPFYSAALHGLAFAYDTSGDFAQAEQVYQRELASREKANGKDSLWTAFVLDYIARVKKRQGDYDAAEAFYQRGLEIREKFKDEDNALTSLANLAGVYADRGDYQRSEEMYKEILARREKADSPNQLMIANVLLNLGVVSNSKGDYGAAEQYIKYCLAILEVVRKGETGELADTLTILATTYIGKGDYAAAEEASRHALAIREKLNGPAHPFVARALNRLGHIRYLKGDYAGAETFYQRALAIIEKTEGPNGQDINDPLAHLALVYAGKGDLARALEFQARANAADEHRLSLALATGSERQKLNYMADSAANKDRNLTLNIRHAPANPQAAELALGTVLRFKGRVLDAMTDTLAALRRRASPQDQALLDQLNDATTQLARRTLNATPAALSAANQAQTRTLEEKREKLEDEISRRSAEFRAQSPPLTLDAIRRAIPDDAALLEFALYRPVNEKSRADNAEYDAPRYVAYVLRKQGNVSWMELGAAKEINALVEVARQALRDPKRKDVRQLARALDEKVMQPVRALVGEATHLLISPDGALNLLPFEALVDEQNRYLIERYSISYLTSGRDLLRMQVARASQSEPLVIASPMFGEPELAQAEKSSAPSAKQLALGRKRQSIITGDDLASVYFAPLAGTEQEAHAIKSLFPEASVLTGQQATVSALKQARAPALLHIATHGFFLEDADSETTSAVSPQASGTRAISARVKIANPLLRSGLALAGANLRKGSDDDGILTALEASGLNLWGTRLVTLSACDTGLGEVKNGEGVYGLRRALVLAGAETLVMSLWPVSDYVTREMMTSYYKGLKQGLGRGEALRQVKLALLHRKDHQHPFYWASFIQAGEWANLDNNR